MSGYEKPRTSRVCGHSKPGVAPIERCGGELEFEASHGKGMQTWVCRSCGQPSVTIPPSFGGEVGA